MLNTRGSARLAGPGLIWAAAAIGSGEVVIGTKVGAEYGYSFLWALWIAIVLKWSIHRGILDITVLSGKSVVDRWHELRFGRLISCYWLVFFLLTTTGLSGLLGLTSTALNLLVSEVPTGAWAVIVTVAVVALLYYQRYQSFEKIMLAFCLLLVVGVIGSLLMARPTPLDLVQEWALPSSAAAGLLLISMLGWGAGSGPDLIIPYSTWVLEKGRTDWRTMQPHELVDTSTSIAIKRRLPPILRIGRIDLASGYIVTGIVASGFMIAGGALLAPLNLTVDDDDVIETLSRIITDSYGGWAFGIFIVGVIAAFLSTFIGVLDGSSLTLHRLVVLLITDDAVVIANRRRTIGRAALLIVIALAPLTLLFVVQQPVTLVVISGVVSAVSMPILGFLTLYSLTRSGFAEHRLSRSYLATVVVATVLYLAFMVISIAQIGQ